MKIEQILKKPKSTRLYGGGCGRQLWLHKVTAVVMGCFDVMFLNPGCFFVDWALRHRVKSCHSPPKSQQRTQSLTSPFTLHIQSHILSLTNPALKALCCPTATLSAASPLMTSEDTSDRRQVTQRGRGELNRQSDFPESTQEERSRALSTVTSDVFLFKRVWAKRRENEKVSRCMCVKGLNSWCVKWSKCEIVR